MSPARASATGLTGMGRRLIRNLSKGYRQRVGLAAALLGDPKVIILDEPTVGLDPAQMIEIRELIHELGQRHTVILSSHILSEVQAICDRVLIISGGKLVAQGTPEELAARLAARGVISATAQGTKAAVLAAAAAVPGLTEVRVVTAEKGDEVSFTAASTDGADHRAALSAALAAAGCPVLSLTSQQMSLEDVFPPADRKRTPLWRRNPKRPQTAVRRLRPKRPRTAVRPPRPKPAGAGRAARARNAQ